MTAEELAAWMAQGGYQRVEAFEGGPGWHDQAAEALAAHVPNADYKIEIRWPGGNEVNAAEFDVVVTESELALSRLLALQSPRRVKDRWVYELTSHKRGKSTKRRYDRTTSRIDRVNRQEGLSAGSGGYRLGDGRHFRKEFLLTRADDGTYLVVEYEGNGVVGYSPLQQQADLRRRRQPWWERALSWVVQQVSFVPAGSSSPPVCTSRGQLQCVH